MSRFIEHLKDLILLPPLARRVRQANLTYLNRNKLHSLVANLKGLDARKVEGDIYEFGIALGGSSILMCHLMGPERRFHGYDLFGMIPPPSEKDGPDTHNRYEKIVKGESRGLNGDPYYGYETDLYTKVVGNFAGMDLQVDGEHIALHQGLFEDTLRLESGAKIALAHVDCDWYDPVMFCLTSVAPHMTPGGRIIIDDYNDYQGCKDASDAFLAGNDDFRMLSTQPHAILERVR